MTLTEFFQENKRLVCPHNYLFVRTMANRTGTQGRPWSEAYKSRMFFAEPQLPPRVIKVGYIGTTNEDSFHLLVERYSRRVVLKYFFEGEEFALPADVINFDMSLLINDVTKIRILLDPHTGNLFAAPDDLTTDEIILETKKTLQKIR